MDADRRSAANEDGHHASACVVYVESPSLIVVDNAQDLLTDVVTLAQLNMLVGVAEDFGHDVALRSGLDLSDDGLVLAPTAQVWETLRSSLDLNDFASQLGLRSPVFRADTPTSAFVSWLTRQVDVTGEVTNVWPRHPHLDEHSLYT